MKELKEGRCPRNVYECINAEKKKKKGKKYKHSGTVRIIFEIYKFRLNSVIFIDVNLQIDHFKGLY